ncbi:Cyclin-J18 [Camellia lanceoleosa]|nr:Cyclin-J18 [Camellia lanceoleosa]
MGAFLCCSKLFWVPFEWNRGVSSVDFREYGNKGLDALTSERVYRATEDSTRVSACGQFHIAYPSASEMLKIEFTTRKLAYNHGLYPVGGTAYYGDTAPFNHPNCETRKWIVLGEIRVGIFVEQDISVETELACDYNVEWHGGVKVRCQRWAPNCSKFLEAKSPTFLVHNHVLEDGDERFAYTKNDMENWLLHPMRESNLQLFALVSIWISRKMHDSHPLSVKCLKSLGDKMIKEQHFTTQVVLMRKSHRTMGIATVGKLVNFEACTDIMDLLYEKDHTSTLHNSPKYLLCINAALGVILFSCYRALHYNMLACSTLSSFL